MAETFKEEEDMDIIGKHLGVMRLERTRSSTKFTLSSSSQEYTLSAMFKLKTSSDRVGACLCQDCQINSRKWKNLKGTLLPIQV